MGALSKHEACTPLALQDASKQVASVSRLGAHLLTGGCPHSAQRTGSSCREGGEHHRSIRFSQAKRLLEPRPSRFSELKKAHVHQAPEHVQRAFPPWQLPREPAPCLRSLRTWPGPWATSAPPPSRPCVRVGVGRTAPPRRPIPARLTRETLPERHLGAARPRRFVTITPPRRALSPGRQRLAGLRGADRLVMRFRATHSRRTPAAGPGWEARRGAQCEAGSARRRGRSRPQLSAPLSATGGTAGAPGTCSERPPLPGAASTGGSLSPPRLEA